MADPTSTGWTADTVKEHLEQIIRNQDQSQATRHEDLSASITRRIAQLTGHLDERFESQTKAVDRAFSIQETALATAYTTAGKNLEVALSAAEKTADLLAASADKRFEAMNEFREQLSDQQAMFSTRAEAKLRDDRVDQLHTALVEEARLSAQRDAEMERRLGSRLDITQGVASATSDINVTSQQTRGANLTTIGLIISGAAVLMTLIIKLIGS